MVKTLNIGVVGCGKIASSAHLPCYQLIENAKVVAVMDPVKERAESTARLFKIKNWYYDYETMVKDDIIDAVDICSPPGFHAEQAIKAAESGKHILCEKPISTKIEDALRLESSIRKAGVKFMTGFTYRFHPLLKKMREAVSEPNFLRISYSFRPSVDSSHWIYSFAESGGFLVEQAVHWFDFFRWCSGNARSVFAKEQTNFPFQNIVALISYQNDSVGLVNYNSNSSLPFFLLNIENSEKSAMVRMDLLPGKWGGILQVRGKSETPTAYFLYGRSIKKTRRKALFPLSFILSKVRDSHLIPFLYEIQHFVDSVQNDTPPEVSLKDGLESLKLAIAVNKSIHEQKEIYLEQ
jgi:predicted dehydrogenase